MPTYCLPFVDEQLKYIFEEFPNAVVKETSLKYTWVEFELKYDHHISALFYAGARYGLHQALTNKTKQS